jgi:hypothetical protein
MIGRRLIGLALLALASLASLPAAAQSSMMSMPMYGNWCGPGHPSNPFRASLKPVDPLDAACMEHDLCIASVGAMNCGCDIRLMNRLKYTRYPHPRLQTLARAMYDAIAMTPCTDPQGMAYKQACVWRDMAADVASGRSSPFDMPMRWMYLGIETLNNKSRLEGWR